MNHELLPGQNAAVNLRLWSSLFCSDGEVPWGFCRGRDATHGLTATAYLYLPCLWRLYSFGGLRITHLGLEIKSWPGKSVEQSISSRRNEPHISVQIFWRRRIRRACVLVSGFWVMWVQEVYKVGKCKSMDWCVSGKTLPGEWESSVLHVLNHQWVRVGGIGCVR